MTLLPTALGDAEVDQLVSYLIDHNDVDRLQRLAESADKKLAKPARRGLHLLKTRGQSLPAPAKREFRLPGPFAADSDPPGLVSLIDGHGERVVWLVRPGQDGFDVYQVELSERRGLIGFQAGHAPKKEWRLHVESVVGDRQRVVARSPHAHVRWLIEEGYERTVAAGRTPPEDFARARLDLGPAERPSHHPARDLPTLSLDGTDHQLTALLELPELSLWVPPDDAMNQLDAEIGQIATSTLVLSPADRTTQISGVVEKLAAQLTADFRAMIAGRLDETALILQERAQPHEAQLCVSLAAALRDDSSTAASPFVRQLFAKLIKPEVKETP